MGGDTRDMKQYKQISASIETTDAKDKSNRRFRNIIANSGLEMESGEVRDIDRLYVMGRDGKLIRISDLATNPDKQTEKYSVNFATNHGHNDPVTGERVVDVEDIIGDAKVWLEDDGLHARVYFANDDPKADHAYAVSDNASYSIGTEWYEEGYYGAGQEIDGYLGILREISMVDTGNDPRAQTLDHKATEAQAQGRAEAADGKSNNKLMKGIEMKKFKVQTADGIVEKTVDELTPDEARAMAGRLAEVIDDFTTDAPESQTQPTRRESTDDEGSDEAEKAEAPAEKAEKADKNIAHQTVLVIKDRKEIAKQEATADNVKKDWRLTNDALNTFASLAKKHQRFDGAFHADWRNELAKHKASTNDGITGLSLPVDGRQLFINAIENGTTDSVRILSHFRNLGGKSYLIQLIEAVGAAAGAETARAHGFKKGDTKINQELTATPRSIYNIMVYKRLDLDALEVAENPELVRIRAEELVNLYFAEIARAAVIGDGRETPAEGQPDYRMFNGTRGFYSMLADAQAATGIGAALATSISMAAGKNMYDASIEVEDAIKAEGRPVYIMKSSALKAYRQATKANGDYVVAPGARVEDSLNALAIYTPAWMDNAPVDAIVFANQSYGLTGDANPTMRPDFDTSLNQDILLVEGPRGGSLIARKAAVAVTFADASA